MLSHDEQGSLAAGLFDRPGRRHPLRAFADLLAGLAVRLHQRHLLHPHARHQRPDRSRPRQG